MTKNETMQKLIAMLRKDAYEATTLVAHYADESKGNAKQVFEMVLNYLPPNIGMARYEWYEEDSAA